MATILVVDDELGIRALLSEILADEGHTIELAENAAQARACRERIRPDLVLLDIWMPDVDGITLLKEWGATGQLTMPVIMMSGHGTIDTAVEAIKFGAMAFLEKPITLQKLLRAVEQGLAKPAAAPRRGAGARSASHTNGEASLTVEAAMTGGAMLPSPPLMLGPQAEQSFDLDRPAARGARLVREELLRVPPGAGERQHDAGGREDRAGADAPVPEAEAAGGGPVAGEAERRGRGVLSRARPRLACEALARERYTPRLRPSSSVGRAAD